MIESGIVYNSYHYAGDIFRFPQDVITTYLRACSSAGLDAIPEHDTLVGRGISGCMAVPMLAAAAGKLFAVVRKPNDGSHSGSTVEGRIGRRWLFVDDFIASGETYRITREEVRKVAASSVLIGVWQYKYGSFRPVDDKRGSNHLGENEDESGVKPVFPPLHDENERKHTYW